MKKPVPYSDVASLSEDTRIGMIGLAAMKPQPDKPRPIVGFITDDIPGKPERYIQKLIDRFPQLEVVHRGPGPVLNTVLVKVQRKDDKPKETETKVQ